MIKSLKIYTFIAVLLVISGCMSTAPSQDLAFRGVNNLDEFIGLYRNAGDAGDAGYTPYLTRVIWPGDENINHENIDSVRVITSDDNSISISAYTLNKVVKEQKYIEGEDFKITGGRVLLDREAGVAGLKGEPLVGLYYGSSEIGLDIKGNAKYRSSGGVAGLAFLFIPIVVGENRTVKFERLE